jgi:hypothetical protein
MCKTLGSIASMVKKKKKKSNNVKEVSRVHQQMW